MKQLGGNKAVAIFRISILASVLMVSFALAMNHVSFSVISTIIFSVLLVFFLIRDRHHFR